MLKTTAMAIPTNPTTRIAVVERVGNRLFRRHRSCIHSHITNHTTPAIITVNEFVIGFI